MHRKTVSAIASILLFTSCYTFANPTKQYQLEQVVTLIRHGIRPQTNTEALNEATGKAWPVWSVPDGHLTARGYAGMLNQAQYQMSIWQQQGLPLLSNQPCSLQQNQLFIWAAPDERTQKTAQAFAEGINPHCRFNVNVSQYKQDPLFDAVKMQSTTPSFEAIQQQFKAKIISQDKIQTRYKTINQAFKQAVCTSDHCQFLDEPWELKLTHKGQPKLSGPANEGANIGETIRLQYSENFSLDQIAFGHVRDVSDVKSLMQLHQAKYIYLNEIMPYAQMGGSILYQQILNALSTPQTNDPLSRPLVIFVGHDTNISQIKTLLGFHWQLPQYLADDIPPGGSLTFSKYKELKTQQYFVKIDFSARTLDQWRQLTPLSSKAPLAQNTLRYAYCKSTSVGTLCPLEQFLHDAQQKIIPTTINQPLFQ
ncbi:histidine-type phosphatase [Acinetobacter sp. B10A]|uniref:histidine-type phosphatase n=1 Tax=Acinetobacter baretiae TaxID=2605383 RepID=UPI001B3C65BB|nr:histidine-type phosphatase [Acinetobacter baretiae]MBF7684609.1 histidine-type phosphatase [Acinetobacter baretiae]